MSDNIKNMFTNSDTSSDTNYMNLHLLLNTINELREEIGKMNEQLNKKFDHLLSFQTKPTTSKTKKTKKNNSPIMEYFINEYTNNTDKFNDVLDINIVNELMSEYENLFSDLDGNELKNKQAECIWSNLISNNKEILDNIEKLYNEQDNDEEQSDIVVKKPTAKKTTATKKPTTRKTKKIDDIDGEPSEKKKTKRATTVKKTTMTAE
jgi:hypothetical protein